MKSNGLFVYSCTETFDMDGCSSSDGFLQYYNAPLLGISKSTYVLLVSAIDSEDSCSTSTTTRPCSVSLPQSSMNSEDLSEGYNDVSSIVSSKEIDIFNEDTDEETEEIAGKTLEPYQFKPVEASDTDQSDYEDVLSSDEELLEILPEDMSW